MSKIEDRTLDKSMYFFTTNMICSQKRNTSNYSNKWPKHVEVLAPPAPLPGSGQRGIALANRQLHHHLPLQPLPPPCPHPTCQPIRVCSVQLLQQRRLCPHQRSRPASLLHLRRALRRLRDWPLHHPGQVQEDCLHHQVLPCLLPPNIQT